MQLPLIISVARDSMRMLFGLHVEAVKRVREVMADWYALYPHAIEATDLALHYSHGLHIDPLMITTSVGAISSTLFVIVVGLQVRTYGLRYWVHTGAGTGIDPDDVQVKVLLSRIDQLERELMEARAIIRREQR